MASAVITGASSGIGRELSAEACRRGYRVLGIGRNEAALRELASEHPDCFAYLVLDLSDPASAERVAEFVSSEFRSLSLLVNNAGYGVGRGILEMTPREILDTVNVNFAAPLLLTKLLLPYMERSGTVVNVVTAGIHVLMTRLPLYGATKIALHYASEALRRELSDRGVNLLEVFPGVVETSFHERAGLGRQKGYPARRVAVEILDAVEKRKKKLYVPRYLAALRLLGPYLPALY
ncbi:SDR family NAD(P)-dependent oxidoreductase [Thermofilum pendens]|uniref:Short-chain dehydrogenase/reductase SDR n=1 Tax=Thermofilum pendens (strain DSM 2475 / Hrk 5) TaxID=368408 RepID=A1S135_THEPD|nr:SDR family NAD(P)-dependent oxidoreductase [Thermofilum pendens]ABL79165.1 short-chain dehydrogenase/reductase SDR [Thermofilum pendens Hrk 5]